MIENKRSGWFLEIGIILIITGVCLPLFWRGNPQTPPAKKPVEDHNKQKQLIIDTFSRNRGPTAKPLPNVGVPFKNDARVVTEEEKVAQDFLKVF